MMDCLIRKWEITDAKELSDVSEAARKKGTRQAEWDKIKNHILESYGIPYLRFPTNVSGEKEQLLEKLKELFAK